LTNITPSGQIFTRHRSIEVACGACGPCPSPYLTYLRNKIRLTEMAVYHSYAKLLTWWVEPFAPHRTFRSTLRTASIHGSGVWAVSPNHEVSESMKPTSKYVERPTSVEPVGSLFKLSCLLPLKSQQSSRSLRLAITLFNAFDAFDGLILCLAPPLRRRWTSPNDIFPFACSHSHVWGLRRIKPHPSQ